MSIHQSHQIAKRAARSPGSTALLLGGVCLAGMCGAAIWRRLGRFEFNNRTVLIAGGSRGLGLILARQLLCEGARVCVCARDSQELDRALEQLARSSGDAVAVQCDITDEDEVRHMVGQVQRLWGGIDVLINNAGAIQVGPIETMTKGDFEEMLDTHLRGPLNTIQAVLPEMRRRRQGRILNVSSIGGLLPFPHLTPYCTSKFALVGLSEGLRVELARSGIVVTVVCPNLMRTGSHIRADFKGQHRREHAWFSIGASLPGATQDAERAASQILDACRYGKARATLTPQGKAAVFAHAVAPGPLCALLSIVNRALPADGGIHTDSAKGYESESRWSPSLLTRLGDRAAQRNNEMDGRSAARRW